MRRLGWIMAVVLTGCASPPPPVVVPVDQAMLTESRAGGLAFALDRPAEAVTHYRAALARARLRDDLPGITDAGTNLAVAELRANQPDQALADARATQLELARRGAADVPVLELVQATALYRSGQAAAADQMAGMVQHAGDPQAAARASFLRGLIADINGDAAGLAAARQALDPKATPQARLGVMAGNSAIETSPRPGPTPNKQPPCGATCRIIAVSPATSRSPPRQRRRKATYRRRAISISAPAAVPRCRAIPPTPRLGCNAPKPATPRWPSKPGRSWQHSHHPESRQSLFRPTRAPTWPPRSSGHASRSAPRPA